MKITVLLAQVLFMIIIFSCSTAPQKEGYSTYTEPKDPRPVELIAWNSVGSELQATVGSIDARYEKNAVPGVGITLEWEGTAWKGERISTQFLLWSAEEIKQVSCKASDLTDGNGNVISAENINTFFIRYVMTDEFGEKSSGCGPRNSADHDSSIVADVLDPIPYFDMEAKTARPVWVAINVPHSAKPGTYTGTITAGAGKQKKVVFNIRMKVQNRVLPKPSDWAFHLDLWQNPYAVARYHNVEPWSEGHFELLRPLMKMLAGAGQKCITATIMHKPWGGQTYDPFDSMIEWKKRADGSWLYDYSDFDRWIEFVMECGITEQMNCYTMIPWGNAFTYTDEQSGKDTIVTAVPGDEMFESLWAPFLQQFTNHLKEKGWENITTIAMDERELDDMKKLIAFIKSVAPGLKITLAGGYYKEIDGDLFDLSIAPRHNPRKEDIRGREQNGLHTTFYVCCFDPYPNNFTFSPPAESAYIGWYAAAKGYNGFLRWAFNSWVENPLVDSRFRTFPAGETYLVYPGARSSIRFERLREGIQDFEKIRILRSELLDENNESAQAKLTQLEEVLSGFEIDRLKDVPAEEFVKKGKELVNYLSEN